VHRSLDAQLVWLAVHSPQARPRPVLGFPHHRRPQRTCSSAWATTRSKAAKSSSFSNRSRRPTPRLRTWQMTPTGALRAVRGMAGSITARCHREKRTCPVFPVRGIPHRAFREIPDHPRALQNYANMRAPPGPSDARAVAHSQRAKPDRNFVARLTLTLHPIASVAARQADLRSSRYAAKLGLYEGSRLHVSRLHVSRFTFSRLQVSPMTRRAIHHLLP
jgi:hypothetical protein